MKTMAAILIEMITTPEADNSITKERREWMLAEYMRLRHVEQASIDLYVSGDRECIIKAMGKLSKELFHLFKFRERQGLGRKS
jgi:hypothetical protein